MINNFIEDASHLLDFDYLLKMKEVIPQADQIIRAKTELLKNLLDKVSNEELKKIKDSNLDYMAERFEKFENSFGFNVQKQLTLFREKAKEATRLEPADEAIYIETKHLQYENERKNEVLEITRMFSGLSQKEDANGE